MKSTGYEIDGIILGGFDLIGLEIARVYLPMLVAAKIEEIGIWEDCLHLAADTGVKLFQRIA